MEAFLIGVALLAGYLLPALIAGMREHRNTTSITMLNLFLGWTFIGWVVALVWAFTAQDESRAARS